MSTKDKAATCIQASFRGFRWRTMHRRWVKAVTKLQALQRGRYTRRNFYMLQERFQQATRRRQIRIWHNEQELYFLQHTNVEDLERVRQFQQQHSARLIQRRWRRIRNFTAAARDEIDVTIAPKDRIYTFDPIGIATSGNKTHVERFSHWRQDIETTELLGCAASPGSNQKLPVASDQKLPVAIATKKKFAAKRRAIQERIKQKVAQKKEEDLSSGAASYENGAKKGSNFEKNRRRDLYQQVVAMKHTTLQRVLQHKQTRTSRQEREEITSRLIASCENQIQHLQAETPEQMTSLQEKDQRMHNTEMMVEWDSARRIRAWNHHRRAVCSVLDKRHWWQTYLAGDERDIRQVVMTKSPWEDETQIWSWPRTISNNQEKHESDMYEVDQGPSIAVWPSTEIQRFLVGDKNMERPHIQKAEPLDDNAASEWWKAHCTQSHLAINGALLIKRPCRAECSGNYTRGEDKISVCTMELVANRDLYNLQRNAKHAARVKNLEQDVEQQITDLVTRVEQYVRDIEAQVEVNTQVALEVSRQKMEQQARITREEESAVTLQRYARGMLGRRHAREVRAEFFVMVRGRAIRRGRCEECGDQRAVLECRQCEESLHFCPICWVHVHSTRRRKTHVAIPMTNVVAPTHKLLDETSKDVRLSKAPTADMTNMNLESVEDNSRKILLPQKQSTTQTAEPVTGNLMKSTSEIRVQLARHVEEFPVEMGETIKSTALKFREACQLACRVGVRERKPLMIADIPLVNRSIEDSLDVPITDGQAHFTNSIDISAIDGNRILTIEKTALVERSESAGASVDSTSTVEKENNPDVETIPLLEANVEQESKESKRNLNLEKPISDEIVNIDTILHASFNAAGKLENHESASTIEDLTKEALDPALRLVESEIPNDTENLADPLISIDIPATLTSEIVELPVVHEKKSTE
ncbi:putative IQ motif, EF-hand binding, B-box-type zinc finger [Plasmopara halstedii]